MQKLFQKAPPIAPTFGYKSPSRTNINNLATKRPRDDQAPLHDIPCALEETHWPSRAGLRADLRRTRDHARAVGDARFELNVEITIILYLHGDPDTGRELTPPDAWRLAADRIRRLLALNDSQNTGYNAQRPTTC